MSRKKIFEKILVFHFSILEATFDFQRWQTKLQPECRPETKRYDKMTPYNKRRTRNRHSNRIFNWFVWILTLSIVVILRTPQPFDRFESIEADQPLAKPNYQEQNERDFGLAKNQSFGFVDNIPSKDWKRMQEKISIMSPNFVESILRSGFRYDFWWFWQSHYEPDFVCQHEKRIGKQGDGGKWICDPHRIQQQVESGRPCLVYSIGSNNDFSFEKSVHQDIHRDCEIHTFDFEDYFEGAKQAGGKIVYHQQGLASIDRDDGWGTRFRSLHSTIVDLGHQNRVIDVFKIDCEGCEYETASSWFRAASQENVTIRQIQVELHGGNPSSEEQLQNIMGFFDLLYQQGYVIFHKEFNLLSIPTGNNLAIEYAFLKLDPNFVNPQPRTKAVEVLSNTRPAEPFLAIPDSMDQDFGAFRDFVEEEEPWTEPNRDLEYENLLGGQALGDVE